MYEYDAAIMKVIDGDTVRLVVDVGFSVHVVDTFRLLRINAPEMNTPEGVAAKAALETLFIAPTRVKVTKKEKYGRWLVEIFIGPLNLNDEMVRLGHATYKEY